MTSHWKQRAACRDFPPERIDKVWFSPPGGDYREALTVCADCPVIVECREAGRLEPCGVWGGTTPADRGMEAPPATAGTCDKCDKPMAVKRARDRYCSARCAKTADNALEKIRRQERKTA